MIKTARGFTLIELLVVVLIIGILAAVAVPQYQISIAKSRLAALKPIISSLKQAQEAYYLEHGTYTQSLENLDVISGCSFAGDHSILKCDSYFLIDFFSGTMEKHGSHIRARYCPGHQTSWNDDCFPNYDFTYQRWFEHSTKPNAEECSARTSLGQAICKAYN